MSLEIRSRSSNRDTFRFDAKDRIPLEERESDQLMNEKGALTLAT